MYQQRAPFLIGVTASPVGLISRWDASTGFCKTFNVRLRDELLNETLFRSLPHAGVALEGWRRDYNTDRPHSPLGWLTPAAYATTFTTAAEAAATSWTLLMAG